MGVGIGGESWSVGRPELFLFAKTDKIYELKFSPPNFNLLQAALHTIFQRCTIEHLISPFFDIIQNKVFYLDSL